MHRILTLVMVVALLLAGPTVATSSSASPTDHHVELTGVGVSVYPSYDAAISRYGIHTTTASTGEIQVRVNAATAGSLVRINGLPTASGATRTIRGLRSGDEVNVQISGGVSSLNQSWIYLPDGFPEMDTVSSGQGPAPGMTAMTLQTPGGDSYPTLVDRNGVPAYVGRHDTLTSDLNRQPNGHYSLAVAVTDDLWGDYVIDEYDEQFRKVDSHRMIGHPRTDFHDTILLPGGGRILMAYIKAPDGQTDSWLQEVAPDGRVLLNWNSRDHVDRVNDPIENALGDYAHLNSMQVMSDGNLLLSFRHLNQVMKIDRETGEVIWRLGGRRSNFTIDDPLGGPCAQHTARELANGDIQIFDNGSGGTLPTSNPLCPDPDDPAGEPVYRPRSRVTVYHLDPTTYQADLVSSFDVGAFSKFAGSAQRLSANTLDDHVFVGLNNAEQVAPPAYGDGEAPDAVELDADGSVVWTLTARGVATYRATKVDAPDRIAPEAVIVSSLDGSTLQKGHDVTADFGCSDTGGSNLDECTANIPHGVALSDEIGTHQLVVTATDSSGNSSTRTATYTVVTGPVVITPSGPPVPPAVVSPSLPSASADAMIRKPGRDWKGWGVRAVKEQTITYRTHPGRTVTSQIKVRNRGEAASRLTLRGLAKGRSVTDQWYAGRREVTRKVRAGTYRTDRLEPGRSVRLRLVVFVDQAAPRGPSTVRLSARAPGVDRDVVRARIRVR